MKSSPFSRSLARFGLSVNAKKTTLYVQRELTAEERAAANKRGIKVVAHTQGVVALGYPLGSDEFVLGFLSERRREWELRVDALDVLRANEMPHQDIFRLLRFCVATCNLYLLRGLPPRLIKDFAKVADEVTTEALYKLVGVEPTDPGVRRRVHQRVHLPTRLGGLGIPSMENAMGPAYLAGMAATFSTVHPAGNESSAEAKMEYLKSRDKDFENAVGEIQALADSTEAAEVGKAGFSVLDHLFQDPTPESEGANEPKPNQRELTHFCEEIAARRLLKDEPDEMTRALQLDGAAPEAGMALHLSQGYRGKIRSFHFDRMIVLRAGMDVIPENKREQCALCKRRVGPTLAHALICQRGQPSRTTGHSLVEAELRNSLQGPQFLGAITVVPGAPEYELVGPWQRVNKAKPQSKRSLNKTKKGDVAIIVDGVTHLVDVVIKGPVAHKVAAAAKKTSGFSVFAMEGEKEKTEKILNNYVISKAELDKRFHPFAISATGAFGERAIALIKSCVDEVTCPESELDDKGSAASYKARLLLRIKERIAARVHERTAVLINSYLLGVGVPFAA